ncbi:CoA-binding protein [Streptomyces alboflavus]|uniref:CoA-binding protein n=1 Tax=Streptomyces alboflavus TaxID=67267 RepID=A0A1Z1WMM6_9ACTN|nr:CoA-binding protein [Streptomyces alboflavus]
MPAEDRKERVRTLLDSVHAKGRTSLTAPEGKVLADAYGIAVPGRSWHGTSTRRWRARRVSAGPSS